MILEDEPVGYHQIHWFSVMFKIGLAVLGQNRTPFSNIPQKSDGGLHLHTYQIRLIDHMLAGFIAIGNLRMAHPCPSPETLVGTPGPWEPLLENP